LSLNLGGKNQHQQARDLRMGRITNMLI
jgi:hypothetical protein